MITQLILRRVHCIMHYELTSGRVGFAMHTHTPWYYLYCTTYYGPADERRESFDRLSVSASERAHGDREDDMYMHY